MHEVDVLLLTLAMSTTVTLVVVAALMWPPAMAVLVGLYLAAIGAVFVGQRAAADSYAQWLER